MDAPSAYAEAILSACAALHLALARLYLHLGIKTLHKNLCLFLHSVTAEGGLEEGIGGAHRAKRASFVGGVLTRRAACLLEYALNTADSLEEKYGICAALIASSDMHDVCANTLSRE